MYSICVVCCVCTHLIICLNFKKQKNISHSPNTLSTFPDANSKSDSR